MQHGGTGIRTTYPKFLTAPELLARTLGFIGACALITLAVGIFAALFVFKRDPDDDKNKSARKSRRTSKYEPEANAFGLVCTPAEPGSPGKPV